MAFAAVAITFSQSGQASATKVAQPITQRDTGNALRTLDVGTIDRMLVAGWNPNTPFDTQRNGALNYLLNMCEWNRNHDQDQMLLMARTLIDGGARLEHRNVWGDTPYSIAKVLRYCGPNTPPTFLTHAIDDPIVSADNSLLMHAAMRTAKRPVELHLLQEGGHGFGPLAHDI